MESPLEPFEPADRPPSTPGIEPDDAAPAFSLRRVAALGLLLLGGALFVVLGGGRYLSFAALAENRSWLVTLVIEAGVAAVVAYIAAYAVLVALSVPGAALLTIAGGFLFGPWLGGVCAVAGATIGATVLFVAARAGLAGLLARAGPFVQRFEAGFRRNAFSYLLVLRLIPVFPFWLVNLVAGAAGLTLPVVVVATLIGIIPVTFIYASLGNGLGSIIAEGRRPDLAILFHPSVLLPILGLAALALLPILYRAWRGRGETAE